MSITVFLVDDHAVVREGLKLLLELHQDIKVVGYADNGRQAVEEVTQTSPSVVIMDIAMPELDGIEATRQICTACGPYVKVIILSMYSTAEHVYRAMEAGAVGYLLKESAGTEVTDAVLSVSEGNRYLSKKISDQVIDQYFEQHNSVIARSPLSLLSSREKEILKLVVEGKSSMEIAGTLFISVKTVETYRSRMMQKLSISDIPGLVKFAIKHGITSVE